jgi:hypothetical protein
MKVPVSQRVRRWCADCDDFTPSGMDAHAVEYCLRCHPQPGYETAGNPPLNRLPASGDAAGLPAG